MTRKLGQYSTATALPRFETYTCAACAHVRIEGCDSVHAGAALGVGYRYSYWARHYRDQAKSNLEIVTFLREAGGGGGVRVGYITGLMMTRSILEKARHGKARGGEG